MNTLLRVHDKIKAPFGELVCTEIKLNENPVAGDLYILDGAMHLELYTLELLNNLELWAKRMEVRK